MAVLDNGKDLDVPTAIICPLAIYGFGQGPVKTRNGQLPFLRAAMLKRGKAFTINEGKDYFDFVHVDDVAEALILISEAALKPNGNNASWGAEGYYFCESWRAHMGLDDRRNCQVPKSKGRNPHSDVDMISVEEASNYHPAAFILQGGNASSRAERLRKLS